MPFLLCLAAIIVVWLVARVVYWNGYYVEDAPGYVTDAIWAALGDYHARDHVNGLNVGTYLPVALPIYLFGKSEVALGLWPMACSLLGLLSMTGVTYLLFGPRLGLVAALLYATHPGDVFFSSVVMPDAMQAGWLSCSMFLAVYAFVHEGERARKILLAAGVAMGVCHLIRANDVALLPIGMVAVAACARIWRGRDAWTSAGDCAVFLTGWATVQIAEGLAYLWAADDFLLRFHVVTRHYGTVASIAQAGLNVDPHTIPFSLVPPLLWWRDGTWGQLNQDQAYHALLFCWAALLLAAGGVLLPIERKRVSRRALAGIVIALVWFLWPLAYHQFGSQSLTHFVPMHRLSRHLVVYAPGAIFAIAAGAFYCGASVQRLNLRPARALVGASALGMLTIHLYFDWQGAGLAHAAFYRIKDTYSRIRLRLPAEVEAIVADPGDLCFFDFWMNPLGSERVRMRAFAGYSSCDDIQGGVVLTQSNPGWEGMAAPAIRDTVERLPCLTRPPAHWRLLYDGYPEKVFAVSGNGGDAR